MIYVGYPCIGKSSIAGHRMFLGTMWDIIDLESSVFNDGSENWTTIYVKVADYFSKQGYLVFISSHKQVRDELKKNNIEYTCIFPSLGSKERWAGRVFNRYLKDPTDKNKHALERVVTHYEEDIEDLLNEPNKIVIYMEKFGLFKEFDLVDYMEHPIKDPDHRDFMNDLLDEPEPLEKTNSL